MEIDTVVTFYGVDKANKRSHLKCAPGGLFASALTHPFVLAEKWPEARRKRRPKSGMAFLELIIALTVFAMALGIGLTAYSQALVARRQQACREAGREAVVLALERVRAFPASNFPTVGSKMELGLPSELADRLPSASCQLSIAPEAGGLVRASIEVHWKGANRPETGSELLRLSEGRRL
jgi:Tfp pilus assembly protein PilE